MFDPEWGWLPVPVDPWAGQVTWQTEPFDWFCACPCMADFVLVG